jgi:hypothetical protein
MTEMKKYRHKVFGQEQFFRFNPAGPTFESVAGQGSYGPAAFAAEWEPCPDPGEEAAVVERAAEPDPPADPEAALREELDKTGFRDLQKRVKALGIAADGGRDALVEKIVVAEIGVTDGEEP